MNQKLSIVVTAAAILFGTSASAQETLMLTGTVRDFKAAGETGGHPDFESASSALVTGIVESTLGLDRTPVYAHGDSSFGSIANASSFASWYHDVPGVNLSLGHTLTLTETAAGSGIYTYSSNAFFPIDNALFGNYGESGHNYHFTFQLAGTFAYNAGAGQEFSFTGDDDVWVFLDNRLAIDLGGAHSAASASVTLDTFMAGKPSGEYAFDFFFAERHTTESNFSITTSTAIVPEPSTIALALITVPALFALRRRCRFPSRLAGSPR